MRDLGCRNFESYLAELGEHRSVREDCERLLTVSISRFFRDQRLWEFLAQEILPELMGRCEKTLKVWIAGCASGEEVYSLKILWARLGGSERSNLRLEILATDLNPACLARAREGVYPPSSLREVPSEALSAYFVKVKGKNLYAVRPSLKEDIEWKAHNFLSDPPVDTYQIIFLRNSLLTYYLDKWKRQAFREVFSRIAKGGVLVIGTHERLPHPLAEPVESLNLPYVFRKQEENETYTHLY